MSSIKCFKCLEKDRVASQCPNKRTMVVLSNGDITSASPSIESASECDVQSLESDLLVVKRLMRSVFKDRDETQWGKFFILGVWSWGKYGL